MKRIKDKIAELNKVVPITDKDRLNKAARRIHFNIMLIVEAELDRQNLRKIELAEIMEIPRSNLAALYSGKVLLTLKTIVKIEIALDMKIEYSPQTN